MSITVHKCQRCGHEWPQAGEIPPRRCPKDGCRTCLWKRGSKAKPKGRPRNA